jgi:hypothetical protein
MKKTDLKPLEDLIIKCIKNKEYYNAKECLKKLLIIYKYENEN